MKTSELTGVALDWAVCKAKGEYQCPVDEYTEVWMASRRYSTNWEQGGPIIEREKIVVIPPHDDIEDWEAYHPTRIHNEEYGPTPLIAAMRCYVASQLGYEVELPEELNHANH